MRPPLIRTEQPMTRINVTPIIDVALVLVIILLVTAPMMSVADLEIDLPAAHARDMEQNDFVSLTLDRDGRVAVDETTVRDPDRLVDVLRRHLAERGGDDGAVVVRADAGVPHALVRDALEQARAAGAGRLGIATRQATGGGS